MPSGILVPELKRKFLFSRHVLQEPLDRPATSVDLPAWLPDLRRLLHFSEASSHGHGA